MKVFCGVLLVLCCAVVGGNSLNVTSTTASSFARTIVNGKYAVAAQFPWQVLIDVDDYFCGGSIISAQWVLTAAHCVYDASTFTLSMGLIERTTPKFSVVSTETFIHPNYDPDTNLNNDIALIKLPAPIALSRSVAVIRLPSRAQRTTTFAGTVATISGFGQTTGASYSDLLQYTTVKVIPNSECVETYSSLPSSNLCVYGYPESSQSSCFGDSGGPLVVKEGTTWTQIGIVSFGAGDECTEGNPDVYIRTASFLTWIRDTTGIPIR